MKILQNLKNVLIRNVGIMRTYVAHCYKTVQLVGAEQIYEKLSLSQSKEM